MVAGLFSGTTMDLRHGISPGHHVIHHTAATSVPPTPLTFYLGDCQSVSVARFRFLGPLAYHGENHRP
ncbi:unnamed protein product [Gadus morhua 'NCC']